LCSAHWRAGSARIRHRHAVGLRSFLHRLTKMSTRWFQNFGFSIGIEDVMTTFNTKDSIVAGYKECDEKIELYKRDKLPRLPGCDAEQTLESHMNGILGRIRNQVCGGCGWSRG
jgi:DNA-directed RNA polymerase III subunit RPC1